MRTINNVSVMLLIMALAVLVAQEPKKEISREQLKLCPVAEQPTPVIETNWDSEYIHCRICHQGVMLPSHDGVVRCTYCGKVAKKEIASK